MKIRSVFAPAAALVTLFLLANATNGFCQSTPDKPLYLDPSQPLEKRVADMVSQMQNNAAAIPRLQVPDYDWWSEALHGVARAGYATVFPQAIGLAATWDPAAVKEMGVAIGTEARVKYNI